MPGENDTPATGDATNATAAALEPGSPASPAPNESEVKWILERIATALEQLVEQHGRGFVK